VKLILAIVQDEDADGALQELVDEGFRATRIASTGSFLRLGNATLLIGVDDHDTTRVQAIIRRTCRRRTKLVIPYAPLAEPGILYVPEELEVEVGGAVLFTLPVVRFERIVA
jgi:uncharacterized protein YaaQ